MYMNKAENNPSKCPICGRPTHKKSKYCIFHAGAEEKTEREFKEALKEYVEKIKKEDGDYNFKKFIFVGNINFKEDLNITIFKNANLNLATFEGNADLIGATFEGDAYLIGVTFKGDATFSEANFAGCATFNRSTFKSYASFFEATFEENAYFSKVDFKGDANFNESIFKKNVSFIRAIFKKNASFVDATFKGDAGFIMAAFKGDANFNESTFKAYASFFEATFEEVVTFYEVVFKGDASFVGATFEGDVTFEFICIFKDLILSEVKVFPGKKLFLNVIKEKGAITFNRIYLENVFLDLKLAEGVLIDFSDALLSNTKIKKQQIENHILQENEKKFTKAKEIFLLLKNNFHSIGQYEDENWAFKKGKDMERKSYFHFKSL